VLFQILPFRRLDSPIDAFILYQEGLLFSKALEGRISKPSKNLFVDLTRTFGMGVKSTRNLIFFCPTTYASTVAGPA